MRYMSILLVLLVLVIGLSLFSAVSFALNEEVLPTGGKLKAIQKAFGPTNYAYNLEAEIAKASRTGKNYGRDLPREAIDSANDEDLKGTIFYNTFHLSDAQGFPKFRFASSENIYLKDRRTDLPFGVFVPISYLNQRRSNLYLPDSVIDVYVLLDLQFFETDLDRFRFLRSTIDESRTRTSYIVKKFTVQADKNGKIPFMNLGRVADLVDKSKLFTTSRASRSGHDTETTALPGMHGTFDYSDTPGNRLSDRKFRPDMVVFDIFIDANRNGRYESYPYTPALIGAKSFDKDYYLYIDTPAFGIILNTLKSIKTCCTCEETERVFFDMSDTYDCMNFCGSNDEAIVDFVIGDCEDMTDDLELISAPEISSDAEDTEIAGAENSAVIEEANGNEIGNKAEDGSRPAGVGGWWNNADSNAKNLVIAVAVFVILLLILMGVVFTSKRAGRPDSGKKE